jgi:glucosamine--fructose-6-phosphate aminotransferase (isomerizing)
MEIYSITGELKRREFNPMSAYALDISKKGFEHYMLKEIFDQPTSFKKGIEGRMDEDFGTAVFPELQLSPSLLQSIRHITILGCGTSWHAGTIAATMIERLARIPTQCEIASEYRYTDPIVSEDTLVIAISQSGETADTIAALKEAKAKGATILSICNVEHSTLTRLSDSTLLIKAGPEVSVCSTKAFTSQIAVLSLFALYLGRLHHMTKESGQQFIKDLKQIPHTIETVLQQRSQIESLAKSYSHYKNFAYLGRGYMYPTCLEAALKLKEISYLHACAYPAGEMKHGPIALVDETFPVVALCGNQNTLQKMESNLQEIKARNGPLLIFGPEKTSYLQSIADHYLPLPCNVCDELACVPYSVAGQLFAYYIAKELDTDIDKPRNLAKSVTVE